MLQKSSRGSFSFVWPLVAIMIGIVLLFNYGIVRSNDSEMNDEMEAKAYLPLVTHIEAEESNGPTLIAPEDNASLQTLIPTFMWDMGLPPDDGTSVVFCIIWGPDQDDLNGCFSSGGTEGPGTLRLVAFSNLEPDTFYYWRVGAVFDYDYDDIHWSETRGFTSGPAGGVILPPPTHISPANGASVSLNEAVLKWSDVNGAIEYDITVHDTIENRYYGWYTSGNQIDLPSMAWWGIAPGDNYEWEMRTRNDYAWSDSSEWWSFGIAPSTSRYSGSGISQSTYLIFDDGITRMYSKD